MRVTCSGVMYWPNPGHGRFGAIVQMDTAPRLAPADFYFDGRRVRLVDLDGTGCADIGFFHDEWLKMSGNSFDGGEQLYVPNEAQFTGQFVDFYGTGKSALIYYLRSLPTFSVMMWDPLEHRTPHLLREVDNHMGRVVWLEYAASTKFYSEDR